MWTKNSNDMRRRTTSEPLHQQLSVLESATDGDPARREYHMNCSKWQRANIMSTHGAYAQNHQYSLHGRRSYTYRPLPDESEVTDDCPVPFPPALSRFRGRIAIIWRWNSAKEMALSPSVSCLKNSLVRSSS
jgi:hypothetical protein